MNLELISTALGPHMPNEVLDDEDGSHNVQGVSTPAKAVEERTAKKRRRSQYETLTGCDSPPPTESSDESDTDDDTSEDSSKYDGELRPEFDRQTRSAKGKRLNQSSFSNNADIGGQNRRRTTATAPNSTGKPSSRPSNGRSGPKQAPATNASATNGNMPSKGSPVGGMGKKRKTVPDDKDASIANNAKAITEGEKVRYTCLG